MLRLDMKNVFIRWNYVTLYLHSRCSFYYLKGAFGWSRKVEKQMITISDDWWPRGLLTIRTVHFLSSDEYTVGTVCYMSGNYEQRVVITESHFCHWKISYREMSHLMSTQRCSFNAGAQVYNSCNSSQVSPSILNLTSFAIDEKINSLFHLMTKLQIIVIGDYNHSR